jgi:hypothetical protein
LAVAETGYLPTAPTPPTGTRPLETQFSACGGGGSLHGIKLHLVVFGIKKSVQMGAAGAHPFSHLVLADALFLRGLLTLPRQHMLDGGGVASPAGREATEKLG